MSDNSAEAELLRRAGLGDEPAFLALYERHRGAVFRFAYRLLGSTHLAEEITHDCFLALIRRPDGYQAERASLRTYLCAAARNLAFKQLRKRGAEVVVEDVPEPEPDPGAPQPLRRLLDEELAEQVRSAVEQLPPLQREALVLFEYEELSLAEIAQVVEADVGTVKSRLHRARERLRRTLAPWMGERSVRTMRETMS
jgi:RNA polymerase sigma-70 factor (ECF subfamily)